MHPLKVLFAVSIATAVASVSRAENQKIFYPNPQQPHFSIVAPADWEFTPAEEEDDYFDLNGPSGVRLQFRSVDLSKKEASAAVEESLRETIDYLADTFKDVKFENPEQSGSTFTAVGRGVDKEDGETYVFLTLFFLVGSDRLAELWYEANASDATGIAEANSILKTFKVPE